MKKTILILIAASAALLSQTASADGRWGRGYDRHYDYGYRYNQRNYYNRGYRGGYIGYSFGGRHRHNHFDTGSFIGGLVLGSVLTYPRYTNSRRGDSYYRRTPVRSTSKVTVVKRTTQTSASSGRRLLRDLEGRCYEILRDNNGVEIRTELEPEACNF